MFENEKNNSNEAETVCVLTMILMNLLLITVIGGTIWSVYVVFDNARFLKAIAHGSFLS